MSNIVFSLFLYLAYNRPLYSCNVIKTFDFSIPNRTNSNSKITDLERTWWRLIWAYLMKVILSVPDEGYSERTWWRLFWASPDEGYSERTWWRLFWAYLMKVILSVPDEGYSERTWWRLFWAYLMKVILSATWWRLFSKHVVRTKLDINVFIKRLCSTLCTIFVWYFWHSIL